MIPTEDEAKALWNTYDLPEQKRLHVTLVARTALFLAEKVQEKMSDVHIDRPLLLASALLHDIDKAIVRLPGELHPDTAVRILRQENMQEVADIVKTHPVHSIIDDTIAPQTWEERLLYLADKMVKYEIVTIDKRFALWKAEGLPPEAQHMLDTCYPKVKKLEQEICMLIGVRPEDIAKFA